MTRNTEEYICTIYPDCKSDNGKPCSFHSKKWISSLRNVNCDKSLKQIILKLKK